MKNHPQGPRDVPLNAPTGPKALRERDDDHLQEEDIHLISTSQLATKTEAEKPAELIGQSTSSSSTVQSESGLSRKFEPILIYPEHKIRDVEVKRPDSSFVHVLCPVMANCMGFEGLSTVAHLDCIVIAIHGAWRVKYGPCKSSAGIYVGENSPYNLSIETLGRAGFPVSHVTAPLEAAMQGLLVAQRIRVESETFGKPGEGGRGPLKRVIIKTTSMNLVSGMTTGNYDWHKNDFWDDQNLEKVSRMLHESLKHLVAKLKDLGVEFLFWKVGQFQNRQAVRLAKEVLL